MAEVRTVAGLCIAIATLLAATGPALAQTASLDALATHARQSAEDARADPLRFAANATTPEWQVAHVNWSRAWTCDATAETVPQAHAQLAGQGLCATAPDVNAGAQEAEAAREAEQAGAQVEELQGDAETTAQDALAAAQAFVSQAGADPAGTPGHLAQLVGRLQRIVQAIVGGLSVGLDVAGSAIGEAAQGTRDAVAAVGDALASGARYAREAIAGAASAVADGAQAGWQGLTDAVAHLASALAGGAQPSQALDGIAGASPRLGDGRSVRGLLDCATGAKDLAAAPACV